MAGGRRSGRAVFWDWATVFAPKGPSWGKCLYLALGPWAARLEVTAAQLDKRLPKAPKGLSGAAWWEERIAACEELLRELGLPEPWVELCARREEETRRKCQAMEEDARRRAEGYWTELSMRLKKFYEEHQALKELLSAGGKL